MAVCSAVFCSISGSMRSAVRIHSIQSIGIHSHWCSDIEFCKALSDFFFFFLQVSKIIKRIKEEISISSSIWKLMFSVFWWKWHCEVFYCVVCQWNSSMGDVYMNLTVDNADFMLNCFGKAISKQQILSLSLSLKVFGLCHIPGIFIIWHTKMSSSDNCWDIYPFAS